MKFGQLKFGPVETIDKKAGAKIIEQRTRYSTGGTVPAQCKRSTLSCNAVHVVQSERTNKNGKQDT